MLESIEAFVQQLLAFGGFRKNAFPQKAYAELLTALPTLPESGFIAIPACIKLAKAHPGCLDVDDTSCPKYGLNDLTQKLFIPATSGFCRGYKILLFLWVCDLGRIPVGFALWHKESASLLELTLNGISYLRNRAKLKPLYCLMDGAFATDNLLQRLENYGWAFVMRCKKNRKLDGVSVRQRIGRGYGEVTGKLKNGLKLKVIRHKSHFLLTNRKLLPRKRIQALYKLRWAVEESFRFLKSGLKLGSCQQHSMRAQGVFVGLCLLTFTALELVSGGLPYQTLHQANFGLPDLHNPILESFLGYV